MRLILLVAACTTVTTVALAQTPAGWDSVARVLQTPAAPAAGYLRYNFPRRDLQVRIGDVTLLPGLALGAWAGFAGEPSTATMMGDLVLTAAELPPVLAELAAQDIAVTAVHNHLVGEEPQVTYVHFHARGAATALAARLDRVLARTATPRPVVPAPPGPVTIDTAMIFNALGQRGRAQGALAQVGFVLVPGAVTMDGAVLVPALAYASPVNIQMVDGARAVATGDFAVLGSRVGPVLRALTSHGITATAVHHHLIDSTPAIFFIHFWADGASLSVLDGLRAALDAAR